MKIYLKQNVFEAALDRIRWLFDEFPNVIVNVSGGKDSTVVRNLALMVAEEKGRLPLKVYHTDLEVEWETVVQYLRDVMNDPRIDPLWLQIPLKEAVFNATSGTNPFFYCWEPGVTWMREKEPNSIKENVYGVERYDELFAAFDNVTFPGQPVARLAGVRTEESPGRMMGLTSYETYKGVTWGNKEAKKTNHYTFYPIYDWSYTDVWKAINDNDWPYCKIYDLQYQHGVPVRRMRISSVLHESAVHSLFYLQEFEAETWNKLIARANGANTAGHMREDYYCPKELPPMFKDWTEYRDYLLENLITDPVIREKLRLQIKQNDNLFIEAAQHDLVKQEINIILNHEFDGIKFSVFHASHGRQLKGYGRREGRLWKKDGTK
jgi:predicted phosphoadenosine phosphosulfate sulfurtransferase